MAETDDPALIRWQQNSDRIKASVPELRIVRDLLVRDIRSAFDGVWRADGITIREARVIDDYGSDRQRAAARSEETDTCWDQVDVVKLDPGGACLTFMDATSFRYYLPAYMTRSLRCGFRELGYAPDAGENSLAFISYKLSSDFTDDQEKQRQQWSKLDDEQRRCAARYLAFVSLFEYDCIAENEEIKALKDEWLPDLPLEDRARVEAIWPGIFD